MLCSKCNQHLYPIVVSDIDGVLGMYHQHFAQFNSQYWSLPLPLEMWDGTGEFEDHLGVDKAQYREAKLAYRQGGQKRVMPVYAQARNWLDNLHLAGAEVWLATTRPWMRHDSTDPDTRWWLTKNCMFYDHLLYDEDKYERLADLVDPQRVVMILEDLPDQYDAAEKYFPGKAVQIARPHNHARVCRKPVRVSQLLAAAHMALDRIEEWKREYD